jgi:hypothetical protein
MKRQRRLRPSRDSHVPKERGKPHEPKKKEKKRKEYKKIEQCSTKWKRRTERSPAKC